MDTGVSFGAGVWVGAGGSVGAASSTASSAVRITFVPHPAGSIRTVPRTCSPSQATAVSGSRRVIRISPNPPR